MKANFKKIFGIGSIVGTAIAALAGIGSEVVKYKDGKSSTDDGHTPTNDEAKALAEACPEAKEENTEENMINEVIEEVEEEEET